MSAASNIRIVPHRVVRICIGSEEKTLLAEQVLIHSIRQRTLRSLDFTPLRGPEWEVPAGLHQGTGFSLRRFLIPERSKFVGRALYLDADQLVLGDIGELWDYGTLLEVPEDAGGQPLVPRSSVPVVACSWQPDKFYKEPAPQTSVMVLNCERLRSWQPERLWDLLRDGMPYHEFMHLTWIKPPPAQFSVCWNHLNTYTPRGQPKHTRLLHYTKEPEQPWVKPGHPLASLWREELIRAIQAGAVSRGVFEAACALWSAPRLDHRTTQGLAPCYHSLRQHFSRGSS